VQKPKADLIDAIFYFGPRDLALRDKMPADIALDADYRKELRLEKPCRDILVTKNPIRKS